MPPIVPAIIAVESDVLDAEFLLSKEKFVSILPLHFLMDPTQLDLFEQSRHLLLFLPFEQSLLH